MARKYSMENRTASIQETRRRIVQATLELHNEKGLLATSMQDIAARADVALGTVYRHFPSLNDLVPACGALIWQQNPMPTRDVFKGTESGETKVGALVRALFQHYAAVERQLETGFSERAQLPVLADFLEGFLAAVHALVHEAIAPFEPDESDTGLAYALSDFHTWQAFTSAGVSSDKAAEFVTSILIDRLRGPTKDARTRKEDSQKPPSDHKSTSP